MSEPIKIDIAGALAQLQSNPELASAMTELIAPTVAPLMERDAQTIERLNAANEELHAEVSRLKLREQDLLEANNRYLSRARRAEDLYRKEPSAIAEAAKAAMECFYSLGDPETNIAITLDDVSTVEQEEWQSVVHAMLSKMVTG